MSLTQLKHRSNKVGGKSQLVRINRECAATVAAATLALVSISGLAEAEPAHSGRYAVEAGTLIIASGGIAGATHHLALTGELGLDIDTASGRAVVGSSSMLQHGVGSFVLPFPAADVLKLTELEGRVREDGTVQLTSPDGHQQEVDLLLSVVGDELRLDGTYVEPCCDRFVFTFEDVRLVKIPRTKAGADALQLHDGRFLATVTWQTDSGATGTGRVAGLDGPVSPTPATASDDSGVFYFFSCSNWELMVKVLDGCDLNQSFWVLTAASTTAGYELEVLDTWTQERMTYTNPVGTPAAPELDTRAFATCDVTGPE